MSSIAKAGAAAATTARKPAVNFILAVGEVEACCFLVVKVGGMKRPSRTFTVYVSRKGRLEVKFAQRLK